jgi:hypothetical protein
MPAKFLQDDLDHVFAEEDFGVAGGCTWNGTPVANVIYDDMDVEVSLGERAAEIVKQPMLTGKTSDFVGIATNDSILVGTETFTVKNWVRDGTGTIEIYLNRSAP